MRSTFRLQRTMGTALALAVLLWSVAPTPTFAQEPLDLRTATPDDGFALAVTLARRAVTTTQTDREVLFTLREAYARDPALLIATSQVVATYFATIAAANDHWQDR